MNVFIVIVADLTVVNVPLFRLPAFDAGSRRRELSDLSLHLATRLRPHLAGVSDPLSGCPSALHHGAVSQQLRGPFRAQTTQRGQLGLGLSPFACLFFAGKCCTACL